MSESRFCTCARPEPRHPIEVRRVIPHRWDGEGDQFDGFVQVEINAAVTLCAACDKEILGVEARLLIQLARRLAAVERELRELREAQEGGS